jgi:hypothetical protein
MSYIKKNVKKNENRGARCRGQIFIIDKIKKIEKLKKEIM